MPRIKRGVIARAAHKKALRKAKGFRGRRGNVFRVANEAVIGRDGRISTPDSRIEIFVIHTDEEAIIARETARLIRG